MCVCVRALPLCCSLTSISGQSGVKNEARGPAGGLCLSQFELAALLAVTVATVSVYEEVNASSRSHLV